MLACSSVKSPSVIYIFMSPSEPDLGILLIGMEKKMLKKNVILKCYFYVYKMSIIISGNAYSILFFNCSSSKENSNHGNSN